MSAPGLDVLHIAFVSILPRIEQHAHVYFRHLQCPDRREDAVAETVALAWAWFLRLSRQGKDATEFPATLASYAARAAGAGRRLCGLERCRDVLSPRAQRQHGFTVEVLPASTATSFEIRQGAVQGQRRQDAYEERLRDNMVTPPPDAAAFRIDLRDWLATRSERDRRIIDDMARGERTNDLARIHRLSPGRISQLRRQLHDDWLQFLGD
jgi:hypothetical protein